jgi:ribosomal protein S16
LEKPSYDIAVVMQRRRAQSPWIEVVWEPHGVVPGYTGAERKLLLEQDGVAQWLHPGFKLELHRDETEGYYLNVVGSEPRVFVLWRMEGDDALPLQVTASSEEASRWLDGGHAVDGVPMPPELYAWVGGYVEQNYRPQPQKRIKPRSFQHPKDRL